MVPVGCVRHCASYARRCGVFSRQGLRGGFTEWAGAIELAMPSLVCHHCLHLVSHHFDPSCRFSWSCATSVARTSLLSVIPVCKGLSVPCVPNLAATRLGQASASNSLSLVSAFEIRLPKCPDASMALWSASNGLQRCGLLHKCLCVCVRPCPRATDCGVHTLARMHPLLRVWLCGRCRRESRVVKVHCLLSTLLSPLHRCEYRAVILSQGVLRSFSFAPVRVLRFPARWVSSLSC